MKRATYKELIAGFKSQLETGLAEYTPKIASFYTDDTNAKALELNSIIDVLQIHSNAVAVGDTRIEPFVLRGVVSQNSVQFTLRSKTRAEHQYKKSFEVFITKEGFADNIKASFMRTLFDFIDDGIAYNNLKILSEEFKGICEEANCPFSIEYTISTDSVVFASNKKLVLGIAREHALALGDCQLVCCSGASDSEPYDSFCYKQKRTQVIEALKGIQTPVQFLASKLPALSQFRVMTRKRVDKQLREFCHRRASNLSCVKSGIGYYEDGMIFALVEKTNEGELTVLLNPFDINTNETVTVDVISKIA